MTRSGVVAGIDGSAATEEAVRWAAADAAARRTGLLLVHAFTWPGFPRPLLAGELPPGFRAGADQVVEASVDLARKLEPTTEVEGCHVDGSPDLVLREASRDADVLVIGSRGLDPAVSAAVGSTRTQLTANAYRPVVVVRAGASSGDHVLIGYDSSPGSSLALAFGLEHAQRHHLSVKVVAAQRHEADVRHRVGTQTVELVQIHGRPAHEILQLASAARLIVIGARGLGGFTGMQLGSVCQTVLHHATCPVAVVPTGMIGG
ncbi:universal stress protein [Kribbella sp. NBC_00382]|uniref:universal stress protein n=1 Tax=Kribbella sp. NBC_00382 TaxID=2975967 RepID=UPI002E2011B1